MRHLILLLAAVCLTSYGVVEAQTPPTLTAELTAKQRGLWRAVKDKDLQAFRVALAPAYVGWAVALGSLAYAALITFVIGNRAGPLSIGTGAKIGALVGFLMWFANLTRTLVDPLLEIVHGGIGGAAIVAGLRRMPAVR
jgi:hypothetical protein